MDAKQLLEQQEKDRADLAALPPGKRRPLSWCSEHDCQMGTCFSLHYPESSSCFSKTFIKELNGEEDVPNLVTNEEINEQVQKKITKQIEDQERWKALWAQSRK